MKWMRKGLIWVHRYIGIALSLLFVVWFVSGIGMMFARGMPRLSPQEKLQREPTIDLARIKVSPAEATAAVLEDSGSGGDGGGVSIRALLGRPVYRVSGETVFADDGTLLEGVDEAAAKRVASHFMNVPTEAMQYSLQTETDQWTLGLSGLPFHKITLDDGTHLYISTQTGDVALMTTRGSRTLAWVAAIPHWLYFRSLRVNQPLWYQIVCWTAGIGCVLALAGIALSVTQLRWKRPFKLSNISSYIPYSGWMRWHYIAGAVFGVLTFTWVFSGLLSMEPFGWAAGPTLEGDLRAALTGGPTNAREFPAIEAGVWNQLLPDREVKEIDYERIQGEPYFVVRTAPTQVADARDRPHQPYYSQSGIEPDRVLINARTMQIRTEPFSADSLMMRVKETWPDVPIVESSVLTEYDSYYYSRDGQRPLPVLRVKFDDPVNTWLYIDTTMSQQVAAVHRLDRIERWIYNGFHSLDFSFWYYNGPLWFTGVIVLSLGGTVVSLLGMYLGFKRMARGARRLAGAESISEAAE